MSNPSPYNRLVELGVTEEHIQQLRGTNRFAEIEMEWWFHANGYKRDEPLPNDPASVEFRKPYLNKGTLTNYYYGGRNYWKLWYRYDSYHGYDHSFFFVGESLEGLRWADGDAEYLVKQPEFQEYISKFTSKEPLVVLKKSGDKYLDIDKSINIGANDKPYMSKHHLVVEGYKNGGALLISFDHIGTVDQYINLTPTDVEQLTEFFSQISAK